MGAQSDFISEQFVPGEEYKAQQKAMADSLTAMGLKPEELTSGFRIPVLQLPDPKAK
jgi:hypothetical protein